MSPKQNKRLPEWAAPALAGSAFVLAVTWCTAADAPTHAVEAVVVECPTVVDVRQDGAFTAQAGRTVPPKPEDWQKRAPCSTETDEVELRGGCYLELARKPPCKSGQYESGGRCFAAIARQRRPNTSVDGVPAE